MQAELGCSVFKKKSTMLIKSKYNTKRQASTHPQPLYLVWSCALTIKP